MKITEHYCTLPSTTVFLYRRHIFGFTFMTRVKIVGDYLGLQDFVSFSLPSYSESSELLKILPLFRIYTVLKR